MAIWNCSQIISMSRLVWYSDGSKGNQQGVWTSCCSSSEIYRKPYKKPDDPVLYYPQTGKGTCGISAFSIAIYYQYDTNLVSLIHLQTSGYVNSLSESAVKKSGKSSSIKLFWESLLRCIMLRTKKDDTVERHSRSDKILQ